jgi:hypothetical protein
MTGAFDPVAGGPVASDPLVGHLDALRAALTRGEPVADGAGPAGAVQVVHRGGVVDHVRVTLPEPAGIERLAGRFGAATRLPRSPAGGRLVLFPATVPADGERATTVLAQLDHAGRATVVLLRPDDLTDAD